MSEWLESLLRSHGGFLSSHCLAPITWSGWGGIEWSARMVFERSLTFLNGPCEVLVRSSYHPYTLYTILAPGPSLLHSAGSINGLNSLWRAFIGCHWLTWRLIQASKIKPFASWGFFPYITWFIPCRTTPQCELYTTKLSFCVTFFGLLAFFWSIKKKVKNLFPYNH